MIYSSKTANDVARLDTLTNFEIKVTGKMMERSKCVTGVQRGIIAYTSLVFYAMLSTTDKNVLTLSNISLLILLL
jgi:hypothetical protein